jgi:hypothetical protein
MNFTLTDRLTSVLMGNVFLLNLISRVPLFFSLQEGDTIGILRS